jgi:excisionase family DNA binding protein
MKHNPELIAYTVADACRAISCSKGHLYNLIRAGKLQTRKLGRKTLIPAHSLHALIEGEA